jgi:hypothetical protein
MTASYGKRGRSEKTAYTGFYVLKKLEYHIIPFLLNLLHPTREGSQKIVPWIPDRPVERKLSAAKRVHFHGRGDVLLNSLAVLFVLEVYIDEAISRPKPIINASYHD